MASLQWSFQFGICGVEIAVILLLLLPLPSNRIRGVILRTMSWVWRLPYVPQVSKGIALMSSLLWLVAMRTINRVGDHIHDVHNEHGDLRCLERSRLLRNQRNAYITGFAFLGMIIIWRLHVILTLLHRSRRISHSYDELLKKTEGEGTSTHTDFLDKNMDRVDPVPSAPEKEEGETKSDSATKKTQ
eukprot:593709_1